MSVYRPTHGRTYAYDFYFRKVRYRGSTGQLRKEDAERWEKREQLRIAQAVGGVAPFTREATPRFQDWAEIYYRHAAKTMKRPDRVEALLRVVLRFWGARPAAGKGQVLEGMPYHDLRLGDPLIEPAWLVRFEAWLDALPRYQTQGTRLQLVAGVGRSGQSRNQYRSVLSQLYVLAARPDWRAQTGIVQNPFAGVPRDATRRRTVALEAEELRRLVQCASYHVRLCLAIGVLAPKLRLANILGLRWAQIDSRLDWMTIRAHKTEHHTGRPLVVPISAPLRAVLLDAKTRTPTATYVVTYRGAPLTSIRDGVRGAATRAGLVYGRGLDDGVTFHTLRHTAATLLAELETESALRQSILGHERVETTQRYTHLRPTSERAPLEQLAATLNLEPLVMTTRRRALAANFGGKR